MCRCRTIAQRHTRFPALFGSQEAQKSNAEREEEGLQTAFAFTHRVCTMRGFMTRIGLRR